MLGVAPTMILSPQLNGVSGTNCHRGTNQNHFLLAAIVLSFCETSSCRFLLVRTLKWYHFGAIEFI